MEIKGEESRLSASSASLAGRMEHVSAQSGTDYEAFFALPGNERPNASIRVLPARKVSYNNYLFIKQRTKAVVNAWTN